MTPSFPGHICLWKGLGGQVVVSLDRFRTLGTAGPSPHGIGGIPRKGTQFQYNSRTSDVIGHPHTDVKQGFPSAVEDGLSPTFGADRLCVEAARLA